MRFKSRGNFLELLIFHYDVLELNLLNLASHISLHNQKGQIFFAIFMTIDHIFAHFWCNFKPVRCLGIVLVFNFTVLHFVIITFWKSTFNCQENIWKMWKSTNILFFEWIMPWCESVWTLEESVECTILHMALVVHNLISYFISLYAAHTAAFGIQMFLHPGYIQWTVYISFNVKHGHLVFPLSFSTA